MQGRTTIFITGAGRGLGLSLTRTFLRENYRVFAGRREPNAELDSLARTNPALSAVPIDVTSRESVHAAAQLIAGETNRLDILVNNAAILPEAGRGTVDTTDVEIGLRVFDVNSLGPLRVTQAFLPLLRRGTRRLIVNVSSEAGSIADCWRKDDLLYCMSKSALNMQTAILKNALADEGFRLLAAHPGWVRTTMGGPDATLTPEESAAGLFALLDAPAPADPNAPFYVDHRGHALRW